MSLNVFPRLEILDRQIVRGSRYRLIEHEAESGREDRTQFGGKRRTFRLTYTVRAYKAAPPPWQAYSERTIVEKFHDDHLGTLDSFYLLDPWDGETLRKVRFQTPELEFEDIVPGISQVELEFIEVIGGGGSGGGGGAFDGGEGLYG